jgi:sulfur-oxidizing protein SoxA
LSARTCFGLSLWAVVTSAMAQAPPAPRAGSEFQPPEMRALQQDAFANPAMLWASQGGQLWQARRGEANQSCADCHGAAETSMRGVATRFPRAAAQSRRLVNLEAQINACTVDRQRAAPLEYESDALLALTAYVTRQSQGMPMAVTLNDATRAAFGQGQRLYEQRVGQLNLACRHCHQQNWGRRLLADTISQGHGTGYPAYRFEWQTLGSLQRRLRACYFGLRADMPPYGSPELLALELYLAWRASGLEIEAPGVRK